MRSVRPALARLSGLFSEEGFRGPVLTLMSGSAVALVAAYLAQPILTRLYSPEAFGISDYFVGVVSILITGASLRYEDALMTPDDDDQAAAVLWLSGLLSLLSALLLIIAIPFSAALAEALRVPGFAPWIALLPIALLLMRTTRLSELWLARQGRYRTITGGDVSNKLSMVSLRLGAGAVPGVGAGGLIGGFVAGHLVSSCVYARVMLRERLLSVPRSWADLRGVASRFRRFPLLTMPSSLMTAVVARLPVLLLPLYFPIDVVGLYGRAFIVLAVPLGLLGNAVSQVFFVKAAEARTTGELPRLTADVHARLVLIGAYPTLIVIAAGPDLFDFVLGDVWREAGEYVRYVGIWLFLGSVTAPMTRLFDVLERQRADLLTSLLMLVVLSGTIMVAGRTGDVAITLISVGIAGSAVRIVQLAAATRGAQVAPGSLLRPYLRYFTYSIPGVALAVGAMQYGAPGLTTAAAIVGGVAYLLIVARDEGYLASR